MLSQKAITDYQAIYKKVYGKEISYEDAHREGVILLKLMKITYRPIPKADQENEKTKRIQTKP